MEAPGQLPACPVLNPALCMYYCFIRVKLLSVNHMTLGTLLKLVGEEYHTALFDNQRISTMYTEIPLS